MQNKTVVITGATSGIGEVAAERLAGMGARVVAVARDPAKADALLGRLKAIAPDRPHRGLIADLSRLSEMKRVAGEIAASEPRVDVLMNNAGAIFANRCLTEDGLERTFALNHMSYFVMTLMLRERLLASVPARIVNTASDAHRAGRLYIDDLQVERRRYKPFTVYGTSKLCNILFTRELAKRFVGTGVSANCAHPGFVATRFGDQAGGLYTTGIRIAKSIAAITPEKGAERIVQLAVSPDLAHTSGYYFEKGKIARPSAQASDDTLARRLWEESERIAGLAW